MEMYLRVFTAGLRDNVHKLRVYSSRIKLMGEMSGEFESRCKLKEHWKILSVSESSESLSEISVFGHRCSRSRKSRIRLRQFSIQIDAKQYQITLIFVPLSTETRNKT